MSDNKKYYYLKFKENYFEQDHIKVIEGMKDGYLYSNILLKLYLKSIKFDGQLRINEKIPYKTDNIDFLASAIDHDSANVMHAINLAKELGVIDILSTGEIFISDIQNFIGHGSTEGERKAKYRAKIDQNQPKMIKGDNVPRVPDKRPPEREIELELEKEIKKKHIKKDLHFDNIPSHLDDTSFKSLLKEYINARRENKKPLSQLALDKVFNKLKPFTLQECTDAVNESIISAWAGVFPKKSKDNKYDSKPFTKAGKITMRNM